MAQQAKLPDPEKVQRGAKRSCEACQGLDALSLILDVEQLWVALVLPIVAHIRFEIVS